MQAPICLLDILGLCKGGEAAGIKGTPCTSEHIPRDNIPSEGNKKRGSFGAPKSYALNVQMPARTLSGSSSLVFISDRYLLQFY